MITTFHLSDWKISYFPKRDNPIITFGTMSFDFRFEMMLKLRIFTPIIIWYTREYIFIVKTERNARYTY